MSFFKEIIVILAGGQGRRMGYADKGTLLIEGERLIDRLVKQISAQDKKILISGSHDYGLSLPFVPDLKAGIQGPVGGLYAALEWLNEHLPAARGFFTVPVDCPVLPADLFKNLFNPNMSCVACDEGGIHPVFAWWRVEDLAALRSSLDMNASISLRRMAELTKAEQVKWPGQSHFANINTPEQLQKQQNL